MVVQTIPQNDIEEDFSIQEQPSKTYRIDIEKEIIEGTCDEIEAIKQAIYCILNTERFEHLIYSWNYGVEIKNLIGEKSTYVIPELERVIKEALIQDDRIEDVTDFEFTQNKNIFNAKFKVITKFNDIEVEKEVTL